MYPQSHAGLSLRSVAISAQCHHTVFPTKPWHACPRTQICTPQAPNTQHSKIRWSWLKLPSTKTELPKRKENISVHTACIAFISAQRIGLNWDGIVMQWWRCCDTGIPYSRAQRSSSLLIHTPEVAHVVSRTGETQRPGSSLTQL